MRFLRSLARRLAGQRGQSVIEALMAVAVLGIAAETTAVLVQTMAKETVANRDRAFATEKALQMLEELRQVVLTGGENLDTFQQGYADGYCDTCTPAHPWYKWTLTTKWAVTHGCLTCTALVSDATSAQDPHSANPVRPGQGYAFCRYVSITASPTDPEVRSIYVRVYAAAPNAGPGATQQAAAPASPTSPPLAEVYGVVHSSWASPTADQVLDLYLLDVENVPGWWTRTPDLQPLMQQAVVSIQASNPGLVVRTHWIRTLAYGRDLEYTPETNGAAVPVTATGSLQKAYVYPGYADFDSPTASDDDYLSPTWFEGRVDVGGSLPGGVGFPGGSTNLGYPMADQFNQAMRLPDEQNLYNVLCRIAENNGQAAPEMSWRLLLEKLNEDDPSVQNAVVANLHGEIVPVPPLRNYSDAAKDPTYYYGNYAAAGLSGPRSFRAVAQPERLWYPNGVTVGVDVYAWDANANEISCDSCSNEVINTITLFIPGATPANLAAVYRTQGNSQTPYYRFVTGTTAMGFGGFVVPGTNELSDNASAAAATFWADYITPTANGITRTAGLRIQLFGTTPTARTYFGPIYSMVPSP